MDAISIRAATAADVQGVLAVWDQARSALAVTADSEEALRGLLARDEDALLVAERDGLIVGALIAGWDGWRGNMYRLGVVPDLRGQGIAGRLIAAAHELLRAKGARRVTALVDRDDPGVQAVWGAAGYEADPGHVRFVRGLEEAT